MIPRRTTKIKGDVDLISDRREFIMFSSEWEVSSINFNAELRGEASGILGYAGGVQADGKKDNISV